MHFLRTLPYAAVALSLVVLGCGESEEAVEEEWEATPTVSPSARLEYRIDSLMNENRRLKEESDAAVAESRRLNARNAELETKLTEAPAQGEQTTAPAPALAATIPAGSDMNAAYQAALDQFNQRRYSDAVSQFQGLLAGGIGDQLAPNCHYWIGESYYAMKQYDEAIQHFETVFDYKGSGKKSYAQFMIGNAKLAKGDKEGAKAAFDKVVSDYPTSSLTEKAKVRSASIK